MVNPVCFMVMPFGRKAVDDKVPGKPSQVDFDALWEKALEPTIRAAGYDPVRADQDLGALIIVEMLERLAWADLVVADLTVPNANVYYEVGVRHAAHRSGCVLLAADWSRPKFDLDQIRTVRYPLPEGNIEASTAQQIREVVANKLPKLVQGESPMWRVQGYEAKVDGEPPAVFRDLVRRLSEFQTLVRTVRAAPPNQRAEKALELQQKIRQEKGEVVPAVALELLYLIRDSASWEEALEYMEGLPESLRSLAIVREQEALAVAKTGESTKAIGALEQLIAEQGDTPERSGLLGGRYKRLYRDATQVGERQFYLDKAIEAYQRGSMLDLNQYYCACNLAQLYRERGGPNDETAARRAAAKTLEACWRALHLGTGDEWLHATLLGAAFDTRDLNEAKELVAKVREDPVEWKLGTTLDDLRQRASQIADEELRVDFHSIISELAAISIQH